MIAELALEGPRRRSRNLIADVQDHRGDGTIGNFRLTAKADQFELGLRQVSE